jgi:hypothetical protein
MWTFLQNWIVLDIGLLGSLIKLFLQHVPPAADFFHYYKIIGLSTFLSLLQKSSKKDLAKPACAWFCDLLSPSNFSSDSCFVSYR